jgi:predicted phosphodiesterase
MTDIHGFSLAFQTVLDDLEKQGPFDEVIVGGDLCEVGPAPAEALDMLRARDFTVLQGNTDADLVEEARKIPHSDNYSIRQIGEDGIAYLDSLVFDRRITPPGGVSPDNDLLAFHANPHDLYGHFFPEMTDEQMKGLIGDTRAAVMAFGHYHVCFERQVNGMLLVDVSAVGNSRDGDLRCKYGIFTWDEGAKSWSVELCKLPYPLEETKEQILSSGLPNPQKTLKKLIKARY